MMVSKMMESKMVAIYVVLLLISANMGEVTADINDCYDACTTGCVNRDTRLMLRCEGKCKIKCDRALEEHGN